MKDRSDVQPLAVSQQTGQDLSQVKDRSDVRPLALGSLRNSPSGPGTAPEVAPEATDENGPRLPQGVVTSTHPR